MAIFNSQQKRIIWWVLYAFVCALIGSLGIFRFATVNNQLLKNTAFAALLIVFLMAIMVSILRFYSIQVAEDKNSLVHKIALAVVLYFFLLGGGTFYLSEGLLHIANALFDKSEAESHQVAITNIFTRHNSKGQAYSQGVVVPSWSDKYPSLIDLGAPPSAAERLKIGDNIIIKTKKGGLGYEWIVEVSEVEKTDNIISDDKIKPDVPSQIIDWELVKNEKDGYQFNYPKNWLPEYTTRYSPHSERAIVVESPNRYQHEERSLKMLIFVAPEIENQKLEDYLFTKVDSLNKIISQKEIFLDGIKALETEFCDGASYDTIFLPNNRINRHYGIIKIAVQAIYNSKVYNIIFEELGKGQENIKSSHDWQNNKNIFYQMLASFKFIPVVEDDPNILPFRRSITAEDINQALNTLRPPDGLKWQLYKNKEAGFSFKYPSYINTIDVKNIKNDNQFNLHLIVQATKIDDLELVAPFNYDKEAVLKFKNELESGVAQYGPGCGQNGIKIIKVQDKNIFISMQLSCVEVCNMSFLRVLQFFHNEYFVEVYFGVDVDSELKLLNTFIKTMPEFFTEDSVCGPSLSNIWKQYDNFYETLAKHQGSPLVQAWFDDFDQIVENLVFFNK